MLLLLGLLAAVPDTRLGAAVSRYESAQFSAARDQLIELIDQADLSDAGRAEARCYLAATYLALQDRASARLQLRQLAREQPSAKPSPAKFAPDMIALANEVWADVEKRRTQEAATTLAPPPTPTPTPTIVEPRRDGPPSRALAFVPLGIGHFAKGDVALGAVFVGLELLLALTATGTVWKLENLKLSDQPHGVFSGGTVRPENADEANRLNQISTATFFTALAAAVVDVVIGNLTWPQETR